MTVEIARKLIDEAFSIEEREAKLKSSMVPKLNKVLPARKAARCLQSEKKTRAVVKYDLAATVPLGQ